MLAVTPRRRPGVVPPAEIQAVRRAIPRAGAGIPAAAGQVILRVGVAADFLAVVVAARIPAAEAPAAVVVELTDRVPVLCANCL
jgi:hypothetical protein